MSAQQIKKVLIVGGGTAGWLTACYLNRMIRQENGQPIDITLVESPDIGIIGVGEATLASIQSTMQTLGIDEYDFMRCCAGTFKGGIRFTGFHQKDVTFWHPFTQLSHVNNQAIANLWLAAKEAGLESLYPYAVTPDPLLAEAFRAPKRREDAAYRGFLNYAYHIDTIELGRYLRKVSVDRGIKHISDTVTGVVRNEQGDVGHVETKENGNLEADLFIDCTGFRGLLINQAMEVPFISFNDVMFNDKAVAMRVPYEAPDTPVNPFTGCYAQDEGWIWEIPLYSRRGTGYVYSSAHASPEKAEQTLRDWAGPKAKDADANHIDMRIGRCEQIWAGNVVALGLSGGFIEPLESTGIYLAEMSLKLLTDNWPSHGSMAAMRRVFNGHMTNLYDEIRDFICMHYCLTEREDTDYWQLCKNHPAIPDSLMEKLEIWKHRLPQEKDLGYSLDIPAFSAISYIYSTWDQLTKLVGLP
jgi:2-polyprenyl-6-methoxyphenol hydroxylase-like FAD-dependent oxidoreductase